MTCLLINGDTIKPIFALQSNGKSKFQLFIEEWYTKENNLKLMLSKNSQHLLNCYVHKLGNYVPDISPMMFYDKQNRNTAIMHKQNYHDYSESSQFLKLGTAAWSTTFLR